MAIFNLITLVLTLNSLAPEYGQAMGWDPAQNIYFFFSETFFKLKRYSTTVSQADTLNQK